MVHRGPEPSTSAVAIEGTLCAHVGVGLHYKKAAEVDYEIGVTILGFGLAHKTVLNTGRTSVFKGAALTVSMRWIDRLIGFVSTLILARLLVPDDFGVIAMASLVIGLLETLLDLGVHVALIQNRNAVQAHYDTAWTIRLIQCAFAALLVISCAPLAGNFFGDLRITPVLQVLSAGLILVGLENIGVIDFQKNMQFGLDFRFVFLRRLAGFLTTILAAWLLHSYWALVIGTVAGRGFGVVLSYRVHAMRPRLSLARFSEVFAVSQWMLVRNIGGYLNHNLHKILVGRRASTSIMGGYTLADDISSMPSGELLAPLNRVLFPVFVEAKSDLAELKRLFLLAQGVQTLIGVPASVGLALVAHESVELLLGEKWMFVVPFVQLLAMAQVVEAIATSGGYIMITLGQLRNVALLAWAQVLFFALGAFMLVPGAGAVEIAVLRLVTVVGGLSLAIWLLMRALRNVTLGEILGSVFRPIFAAGAMAGAIVYGVSVTGLTLVPTLTLKIATGIIVYSATVLLLWWVVGKPKGAESYVLDKMCALKGRWTN